MSTTSTCWDACIASLPPDKRAAAERAYQDIESGGPDGLFPKLFLLLEAHAAYTNTIPNGITEAGERAVARIRELADNIKANNPGVSKEDMERLLKAIERANCQRSIAAMELKTEDMSVEVKRLNRQVSRLRNLRMSFGFLLLVLISFAVYEVSWRMANRDIIKTVSDIKAAGLGLEMIPQKDGVLVEIYGPHAAGEIIGGEKGEQIGVRAKFTVK
jgi:hypothetical protein